MKQLHLSLNGLSAATILALVTSDIPVITNSSTTSRSTVKSNYKERDVNLVNELVKKAEEKRARKAAKRLKTGL
jgi:hypothetical protein